MKKTTMTFVFMILILGCFQSCNLWHKEHFNLKNGKIYFIDSLNNSKQISRNKDSIIKFLPSPDRRFLACQKRTGSIYEGIPQEKPNEEPEVAEGPKYSIIIIDVLKRTSQEFEGVDSYTFKKWLDNKTLECYESSMVDASSFNLIIEKNGKIEKKTNY